MPTCQQMPTTKTLRLTRYQVKGYDLRSRERYTGSITLDAEAIAGIETMGMNVKDAITQKFAKKGYYVAEVARLDTKAIPLDLSTLYDGEGAL